MAVKYFCDLCGKELFEPIDYIDIYMYKCHMVEYDIKKIGFVACPSCRAYVEERVKQC